MLSSPRSTGLEVEDESCLPEDVMAWKGGGGKDWALCLFADQWLSLSCWKEGGGEMMGHAYGGLPLDGYLIDASMTLLHEIPQSFCPAPSNQYRDQANTFCPFQLCKAIH